MQLYNYFMLYPLAAPVIISVFATPPNAVNAYTLRLPTGYSGVTMTCVSLHFGFSTPIESVAWYKTTELDQERKVSTNQVIDHDGTRLIIAELVFDKGFQSSDEGSYSCAVTNIARTLSHTTFTFELGEPALFIPCSLNLAETHTTFQLRILDVHCKVWNLTQIELIMAQLQRSLIGVLSALCIMCSIDTSTLILSGRPRCSGRKEGAVLISGMMLLLNSSRRMDAFCALSRWHQSGPTVLINDSLHSVDQDCDLFSSPNLPECGESQDRNAPASTVAGITSGSVLIVAALVLIVICIYLLNK